MLDNSLRRTKCAWWYDAHTNFHHGKEMEDIAILAAMNHLVKCMSNYRH